MPDAPRIVPLPPPEWPASMGDALAALLPATTRHPIPTSEGRPQGVNALGLLARHPDLARAFHGFVGHLLFNTTLSLHHRELVILRVAHLRGATYEWAQHVVHAREAGIDADDLRRIVRGPEASGWSTLDRAMLRAVDELIADAMLTDATWQALATELEVEQLLDLIFTVGAYDLVAMAFNASKIPLDDDLVAFGEEVAASED